MSNLNTPVNRKNLTNVLHKWNESFKMKRSLIKKKNIYRKFRRGQVKLKSKTKLNHRHQNKKIKPKSSQ